MIRNVLGAVLLGGLFALPAVPVLAQAPPAPAARPADPAARAEAVRVIEALNLGSVMEQTVAAMRPGVVQQMQGAGRANPQQAEAAFNEVIAPAMRAATPEMLNGIADIWARHFTTAELREMRAFYDTPLGRKSLAIMPQMMAETQQMVGTIVPRILGEVISKNRDALRQRGVQL